MCRIGLLITMILWVINFCQAQIRTTALSQSQLLEIQKLPVQEITSYLSGLGWQVSKNQKNLLRGYFNYPLGFKADKWQPNLKNQWEGTLYVYYKNKHPNLLIYQTTKAVFNNLKPTYLQSVKEKNVEISIITKYGLAMEFRNYLNEKTARKYSILCYDIESIKNMLYTEKQKIEEENSKEKTKTQIPKVDEKRLAANQERQRIFNANLELADGFYKQGLFDKALDHYRLAKQNSDITDEKTQTELELKIQNCSKNLQEQDLQSLRNKADDLFTQGKYHESLKIYESASMLYPGNQYIKERIECIREVLKNTELVNTNRIYRKINPDGFARFNNLNITSLNFMMKNAEEYGNLNYTFNINFDEKGNNLSIFKINSISDENLMFNLTDVTVNAIPASEISIPCISRIQQIASTDILNYNLKWESTIVKAVVGNEITYSGSVNDVVRDSLNAFIHQFPSKTGIYTFKITNKNLNERLYEDVWLTSYKNNPLKASTLIPGFAVYNSSEGKRGKERMIAFLISTAFAIRSKLYSDHQFEQYKNSSNIKEKEHYYNKANFANKCFIISGGFAVGIYIYDLSSFIVRSTGIRNNRALKAELKNGPVSVMENPFNP